MRDKHQFINILRRGNEFQVFNATIR